MVTFMFDWQYQQ